MQKEEERNAKKSEERNAKLSLALRKNLQRRKLAKDTAGKKESDE